MESKTETTRKEDVEFDDLVYAYTTEDAVEDGVLIALKGAPVVGDKCISHITPGIAALGYLDDQKVNVPNLMDLVMQVSKHAARKGPDRMYILKIEAPSGSKVEVYACVNETGKLTVMLPSEY